MKEKNKNYESRRGFLTRTWEIAATLPLVGFIAQNFMNRTSYYSIDDSSAQHLEKRVSDLDLVRASSTALSGDLENLNSSYRRAYHKRHTRLVPSVDSKGKMKLRTQVYYRWEEPSNFPNHSEVESWGVFHNNFSSGLSLLANEATVDLERLKELAVVKQTMGEGKEGLVSLAMYTPQIAVLLFYEEIIAKMRHGDYQVSSAEELVDKHDTSSQISRRSFFKALAALGSGFTASRFTEENSRRREEGKEKLEAEIERIKKLKDLSDEEAFSRYFGRNPDQLIEEYGRVIGSSEATLKRGVGDGGVSRSFEGVVKNGSGLVKSLEEVFKGGVPKNVGEEIKSALISRDLKNKSLSEHRAVYSGLGLTWLAVAGTIAGILVPLEIANEYYANRFEKKK